MNLTAYVSRQHSWHKASQVMGEDGVETGTGCVAKVYCDKRELHALGLNAAVGMEKC